MLEDNFSVRCAQVPELEQDEFKFLRQDAPWMDAVHAVLGSDCKLHYMGW